MIIIQWFGLNCSCTTKDISQIFFSNLSWASVSWSVVMESAMSSNWRISLTVICLQRRKKISSLFYLFVLITRFCFRFFFFLLFVQLVSFFLFNIPFWLSLLQSVRSEFFPLAFVLFSLLLSFLPSSIYLFFLSFFFFFFN